MDDIVSKDNPTLVIVTAEQHSPNSDHHPISIELILDEYYYGIVVSIPKEK